MKKILLIEDEKILAEMYQDRFVQAGFKVYSTSEAEKGLKLVKKEKPDLVVLDILLPRGNGIFFLQQIRKDPTISSTSIIVFSNFDDPETKKQALELGAKDYLIKTDYTPQEIIKKIKEYLR